MVATLAPPEGEVLDPLTFVASNVAGMHELEFDRVDGHRLVSDVALTVAGAMDLPTNLPWALRDDESARMLDDERPLGSQVRRPGSKLVVIPKSHLG